VSVWGNLIYLLINVVRLCMLVFVVMAAVTLVRIRGVAVVRKCAEPQATEQVLDGFPKRKQADAQPCTPNKLSNERV
jgi:hypothetical protein